MAEQLGAEVPAVLRKPAMEALAWINQTQQRSYQLTGVVDYDEALVVAENAGNDARFELGLVLCDGEICSRQQIRVQQDGESLAFSLAETGRREIPSLLDPPEGVRSKWLANALERNEFVLLLFYRGLW